MRKYLLSLLTVGALVLAHSASYAGPGCCPGVAGKVVKEQAQPAAKDKGSCELPKKSDCAKDAKKSACEKKSDCDKDAKKGAYEKKSDCDKDAKKGSCGA